MPQKKPGKTKTTPSRFADSAQFSSVKQEQDADSHLSGDANNFNSFLDNATSFEFKRKRSLDSSNASDDHEMGFKSSSYEDLHSQDNFAQTKFSSLTKTYSSANSKSPNASGSLIEKKAGTLEALLKDGGGSAVVAQKKERKRKKTEPDPNKNVALSSMMVSNVQLMPPPTSTTSGLVAGSSTGSSSFGDSDSSNSSVNSPALRQITLNVKPTMSTAANLNTGSMAKVSDKNLANKLKQGSPKNESDSFNMSNYSPKSSPKLPKASKQPKIINTPTNASLGIATSPKSQTKQQQQSLKLKSLNTAGLTITKTTSITSPITICSPTSASPLSPKTQNPLLLASKTAVPTKKGKGSLSAVIDKLSVRVSATTTSNNDDNSIGSLSSNSASSKDGMQLGLGSEITFTKNESNKEPGAGKLSTSPASLSKLNENKAKYTKPDYTVKQSSITGLKFTVTKTTKSPLLETKAKNSNTKPSIANKNLASSSLNSSASSLFQQQQSKQSTNKTSTGIKRQLNAGMSGFKAGQPGSKSGATKSVSPESADQILEAALPKIHLDKLPKIPKTLNSQQSAQQTTSQPATPTVQQSQIKSSLQAKFLQQQHLKQQQTQNLLRQQLNYNNSLNSGNQLHFRKYGNNQRPDLLSQPGNQLINQPQTGGPDRSNDPSFVSSSIAKSANVNDIPAQHQVTPFGQVDAESQNKNEPNKTSLNKSQLIQGISKPTSSTAATSMTASSSSITVNPSSTPSSPMECNVIPDVYQKSPPLIPTETIEEQQTPSSPTPNTIASGLVQFPKTKTVFDIPSSSVQQKKSSLESTIAKLSEKQHSIVSISSFNLPSTSKLTTTAEVKKVFLDEDDEERLFIDEDISKKSNSSTPSKVINNY